MKFDDIKKLLPAELRPALEATPNNRALLIYAANQCGESKNWEAAEQILRFALAFNRDDVDVQLALANCFYEQDKTSESLVLVEQIVGRTNPLGEANVLHARLLLRRGEFDAAKNAYHSAIERNAELSEDDLTEELGSLWKDEQPQKKSLTLNELQPANDALTPCKPELNFSDVGGMESLKEEIRMKVVYPLQKPDLYAAYGKKAGGGILLYGPPGCGKTYLARATAGEIDATFISVGISDVLNRYLGESEKNLRQIFEQARRQKPCVLFFDEVDALGASRVDMRENWFRSVINQFLVELDGVDVDNEGVMILAATNAPWFLDPAFRRPGRFDRVLFVPPPDHSARAAILKIQLEDKPTDQIDYEQLAKKTEEFSSADLKGLVGNAVESKLREAIKAGHPTPLTNDDLVRAIDQYRPTADEWFANAKNYVLFANASGQYDDLRQYLQ